MEKIQWQIIVPVFRNTVILKQMGFAIGIPFGLVGLVIILVSGRGRDTLYALGFIIGLLALTWLFIMAVYQGKYQAEFVLDSKGALYQAQAKQAKKNRIINTLTIILSLLTGKPVAAGAGMLAQSQQEVFIRWNHVTKVKYKPKSRTVLLRGGWTENIALFCLDDNYEQIEAFVCRNMPLPEKGDDK